ncbi:Hypothetical_protein [Hexamita inflata]|uniref:Hypothetical_protein n=1 Tax=Hexamita inflata TaxID=28002 RepID=A0AA86QXQ4_9EUKA|nr:Hypothetical protein HINF_LOCUS49119 [Hexamita inflata]
MYSLRQPKVVLHLNQHIDLRSYLCNYLQNGCYESWGQSISSVRASKFRDGENAITLQSVSSSSDLCQNNLQKQMQPINKSQQQQCDAYSLNARDIINQVNDSVNTI